MECCAFVYYHLSGIFKLVFRDGYSCGWIFSLNPWVPQDHLSTSFHAKRRSRIKEPNFQILQYKIYFCLFLGVRFFAHSLVQVLSTLHHMEHKWCDTRWCQCYRREDEWHLCERVRPSWCSNEVVKSVEMCDFAWYCLLCHTFSCLFVANVTNSSNEMLKRVFCGNKHSCRATWAICQT